jgi:hypothetical protein
VRRDKAHHRVADLRIFPGGPATGAGASAESESGRKEEMAPGSAGGKPPHLTRETLAALAIPPRSVGIFHAPIVEICTSPRLTRRNAEGELERRQSPTDTKSTKTHEALNAKTFRSSWFRKTVVETSQQEMSEVVARQWQHDPHQRPRPRDRSADARCVTTIFRTSASPRPVLATSL